MNEVIKQVFFGNWSDLQDMRAAFADYKEESPVPHDIDVVFASYNTESYEGDAIVVFRRDGKLFESHGSHCSCYGLEDQWGPEEATVESLKKTITNSLRYHDSEAIAAWDLIVAELEKSS